jgi:hypothetical protein
LSLIAILMSVAFVWTSQAIGQDAPGTQPATEPAGGGQDTVVTSDDGVMTLNLPAEWKKNKPETGYAIAARISDSH